jgi:hypothetical protein
MKSLRRQFCFTRTFAAVHITNDGGYSGKKMAEKMNTENKLRIMKSIKLNVKQLNFGNFASIEVDGNSGGLWAAARTARRARLYFKRVALLVEAGEIELDNRKQVRLLKLACLL